MRLASNRSSASLLASLVDHRPLILQLIQREIRGRYAGSFLGVVWSFLTPIVMLGLYTLVFGVIFKSRWRANAASDPMEFAVVMFSGIMIHAMVAECITRAPSLIVGNTNFVKKVVFPLEVLGWVTVGVALFHFLVAMVILAGALLLWKGAIPLSILLVPVLILPLALMSAGFVWFLSALAVYVRDLGQLMGIVATLLLFLAPVFYPLHSVPDVLGQLLYANPITFIIEQVRQAAIWGEPIAWVGWALYWIPSYAIAWLGWTWFKHSRNGFADVL